LAELDPDAIYTGASQTLFFDASGAKIDSNGLDESADLQPIGTLDDDYSDLAKVKTPVYEEF